MLISVTYRKSEDEEMTNSISQIQLFETQDGQVNLEVRLQDDTVWLSTEQMSQLFARERSVLTKHINNVFKEAELELNSNVQNLHIAYSDKPIKLYSLDVIISVGYRVKSARGVLFRKWATQTLKQHLVQGYTLNQQRFEENALTLEAALELVRKTAKSPELDTDAGRGLVEIVSRYTQTFLWLQRYDEGLLNEPAGQSGGQLPTVTDATAKLQHLKQTLIAKGEATDLFAQPRDDGLAAILGNLNQSVFGEPAYPTIESKAAHLLYFVVKNHPFSDGNKRSGAFLFVDFLHINQRLFSKNGEAVINDTGLAALTLLVAESDPKQKDVLIKLIMTMLSTNLEKEYS
jgi:prophage maintenance system killer protein